MSIAIVIRGELESSVQSGNAGFVQPEIRCGVEMPFWIRTEIFLFNSIFPCISELSMVILVHNMTTECDRKNHLSR